MASASEERQLAGQLTGQVAVVTGASRGLGACIARQLVREGARVALLARDAAALQRLAEELGKSFALAVPCDVTVAASVQSALAQVRRQWGEPLLLVNNAGAGGPFHLTTEVSDAEWEQLFALNVRSAFWFTRALLPAMQQAGYGRIVNVASIYGLRGGARSSTYAATKHALVGYTRSVAQEVAAMGITCNTVCPGFIATEGVQNSPQHQELARRIPAGRMAQPDEVAEAIVQLLRPASGFITGTELVLDGGQSSAAG